MEEMRGLQATQQATDTEEEETKRIMTEYFATSQKVTLK